jgi:hypothetical protein
VMRGTSNPYPVNTRAPTAARAPPAYLTKMRSAWRNLLGGGDNQGRGGDVVSANLRSNVTQLAVVCAYYFTLCYFRLSTRTRKFDFSSYYVWAYGIRHGINPYLTDSVTALAKRLGLDAMSSNYPPTFILAIEPLGLLPVKEAHWLWIGLNLCLLLIAVRILVSDLGDFHQRLCFATAALLYGPVTDALFWGQAEIVVLLLLVIALRESEAGKDRICGIVLGLATMWKIYPIVLLGYFLFQRRWAVVVSTVMTLLAGVLLSEVAFQGDVNRAFLNQLSKTASYKFWPYTMNVSVAAVIAKNFRLLTGPDPGYTVKFLRTALIALLLALAAAMTVNATWIAKRRGRSKPAFGLWVAAAVVFTPIVWAHHLTVLLIPLAQIVGAARSDVLTFRLSVYSYCCSELALLSYWVGWGLWRTYLFPIQFVASSATFAALLLAFGAAYALVVGGCKLTTTEVENGR